LESKLSKIHVLTAIFENILETILKYVIELFISSFSCRQAGNAQKGT